MQQQTKKRAAAAKDARMRRRKERQLREESPPPPPAGLGIHGHHRPPPLPLPLRAYRGRRDGRDLPPPTIHVFADGAGGAAYTCQVYSNRDQS